MRSILTDDASDDCTLVIKNGFLASPSPASHRPGDAELTSLGRANDGEGSGAVGQLSEQRSSRCMEAQDQACSVS